MSICYQRGVDEHDLITRARAGEPGAFDALVAPHTANLRRFLWSMIGHPDDAEDLAQETLLTAQQKLTTFRGDAAFRTWLFSVGTRKALDALRKRKRWPVEAQQEGERRFLASGEATAELGAVTASPEFAYDYRQHMAYCFSCVARSLEPEQSAALLLKELLLFESGPASRVMGVSESTYRHRLRSARQTMKTHFEGLCALVGKQGVCYQCEALREYLPESKRGREVAPLADAGEDAEVKLKRRLDILRNTELTASPLHQVLLRFMGQLWDGPPPPASTE